MMQKIVVEKAGSFDQLKLVTQPIPVPKSDEVLIEVKACGVNFADCCVRMGVYSSAKVYVGWPITPGFEVAGVVMAVGEKVKQFQVGQSVIALCRFGGYTSHLAVSANYVFPLPAKMTFAQGASFPAVFLTAYYAMFELVHPKKADKMLVHSAAGGVGSALMQLAKIAGCDPVGVVGAPHKIETLRALGFSKIIDKSQEDLWTAAEEYSPHGYEAVFDANGVETLRNSYRHLTPGGKLVIYGFHTMFTKGKGSPNWLKMAWDYLKTPRFNPLEMTSDNHSVMAFNLSYLFDKIDIFQDAVNTLLKWYSEGSIELSPITEFPLKDVAKAHYSLESGQTVGKIVLIP